MTTYPEDVVGSAHTKTFAKKSKMCLRLLTQLDAFVHGSDDIHFCQELVCDAAPWSHHDPECDVAMHRRVDDGQGADFANFQSEGALSRSEV